MGFAQKLNNEEIIKIILKYRSDLNRRVGRLNLRWIDRVVEVMGILGEPPIIEMFQGISEKRLGCTVGWSTGNDDEYQIYGIKIMFFQTPKTIIKLSFLKVEDINVLWVPVLNLASMNSAV